MDDYTDLVTCTDLQLDAVTGKVNGVGDPFAGGILRLTHFDKLLGNMHREYVLTKTDLERLSAACHIALKLLNAHE